SLPPTPFMSPAGRACSPRPSSGPSSTGSMRAWRRTPLARNCRGRDGGSGREAGEASGYPRDRLDAGIGEGDAQMPFLARTEVPPRQRQDAPLRRQLPRHLIGRRALEGVPQIGEIGADGVEPPAVEAIRYLA